MGRKPASEPSAWAELREAQAMTLKLPNTGMATAIDVGEAGDIHPKNKREVGRRLALIALHKVYGMPIEYAGPIYEGMKVEGSAVRLNFIHAEGLMTSNNQAVTGFAIAGEDKVFHWATAKIEGNAVVVSSPDVPHPVAVRYAWADNPDANLVNGEALPAFPFRTDDWPGVTINNK